MSPINPYDSPTADGDSRHVRRLWRGGAEATLIVSKALLRKVMIQRPVEATIEYNARGLLDRVLLDGQTVASVIPVVWFCERFDFLIPTTEGELPCTVRVRIGRLLRMKRFSIEINGVVAYSEPDAVRLPPDEDR